MRAIGRDPKNPTLKGVSFLLRDDGQFSGILRGDRTKILRFFDEVIPPPSGERRLRQSRQALRLIAEAGVTNVSDMSDFKQLERFRSRRMPGVWTVQSHVPPPLE